MNPANDQLPVADDHVDNDSGLGSEQESDSDSDSGIELLFDGIGQILDVFADQVEEQETTEEEERLAHSMHQAQVDQFNGVIKQMQANQMSREESQSLLGDFCRICRDNDKVEPFESPCDCKGSMAMVHLSCLEHWLAESDTTTCELCSHQYNTVRSPRTNIFQSMYHWITQVAWRSLLFDMVTLAMFTPVAIGGTYCGTLASDAYYLNSPASPIMRTATLCMISLMAAIDTFYLGWSLLRAQYHFYRWYSYWRRNSVVRVILPARDDPGEDKAVLLQDGLEGDAVD